MANYTGIKKLKIGDNTFELAIPTAVSQLTNDSGFITSDTKVTSSVNSTGNIYFITGSNSNGTSTSTLMKHTAAWLQPSTDSSTDGAVTLTLGNDTAQGTAGAKQGLIKLYAVNQYFITLKAGTLTGNRTFSFPNQTGTIALTSDIPDVSGKIDTAGSGLSKSGTTLNHTNSVTAGTAGTSSATSGSTLAVPYVTYDAQGHITGSGTHTHTISGFSTTDTKNTAGSTDTSSKIFLIGATSQAANPQTYSHDTAYVGTDGCLYSGGSKVLTSAVTSLSTSQGAYTAKTNAIGAVTIVIPTRTSHITNDSGFLSTDDIADYIVEEGTDGIWTYRKWNSGISECWGNYSVTLSHYAQAFGGYAYNTAVDFPSGLFLARPNITYSAYIQNAIAVTGTITTSSSKDTAQVYAVAGTSGSKATNWYIKAVGTWK